MDDEYRIAMSAWGLFPTNYESSIRILNHMRKFLEEEEALRQLTRPVLPGAQLQAV